MKRKIKKADLIITADWHLRESIPICRTDDFLKAQWSKVQEIEELQKTHDCSVIHAGDLFDHWKPSPHLLSLIIANLPERFLSAVGNHDMPQHNHELLYKSGIMTLVIADKLLLLGVDWGKEPDEQNLQIEGRKILVWHVMTYQGRSPWPGCQDLSAKEILEKYPKYDLIITGHNHKTFIEKVDGRILVNPGSITRQTADQIAHRPCVFLWYAKNNEAFPYYLDFKNGVISTEHLDRVSEKNSRISAFIEKIASNWEMDLSFEDNLERFFVENNTRNSVKEIIRRACDGADSR